MLYQDYLNIIDEQAAEICGVADGIWDLAETAFGEYRSSDLLSDALEKNGFTVTRGIADLPTAFRATFGSGHPAMGILAEYDALSGLNQAANVTEPIRIAGPDIGHGCGHNLFAGGSFAAALAVKAYIEKTGIGSVTLFGCPAEEGGSGKVFMAREGVFSGIDAIVSWHPEKMYMVRTRPALANTKVSYSFTGIAAHAGGSPHKGRSALDAVELMNVGCNYLREHMEPSCRIHYAVTDSGGLSPNVVQAHAQVLYMIRATDPKSVQELKARVDRVAQGAAMMTDTTVTSTVIASCSNLIMIPTLQQTAYEIMQEIPLPVPTEEDLAFGRALQATPRRLHRYQRCQLELSHGTAPHRQLVHRHTGTQLAGSGTGQVPLRARIHAVCRQGCGRHHHPSDGRAAAHPTGAGGASGPDGRRLYLPHPARFKAGDSPSQIRDPEHFFA